MCNKDVNIAQDPNCPAGCCDGTEILCVSIPCPVSIVLLGISLQVELPCLRLTSPGDLTTGQVNQLLTVLTGVLGSVGTNLPGVAKK